MERPVPNQDLLVEDSDPSVSYSGPPSAWNAKYSTVYHGNDTHWTYNASASASLHFTGSYVWYYSDFNDDHGAYSISLDGSTPPLILSSYSLTYRGQELLFATAVDPGPHVLTITNVDDTKAIGVDYFYYRPLTTDAASSPSSSVSDEPVPSVTPPPQNANTLRLGDYAAIVLGYTTLSTSCVLLLVLCCIHRTRATHDRLHIKPYTLGSP